jgi:hypothetical protein
MESTSACGVPERGVGLSAVDARGPDWLHTVTRITSPLRKSVLFMR